MRPLRIAVPLLMMSCAVSGITRAQAVAAAHQHEPTSCVDIPAGTPRPRFGCFNVATVRNLAFNDSLVTWYLYTFPTRAAAESVRTATGSVIEEDGRVWLGELATLRAPAVRARLVARIGPMTLPPAPRYTAVFSWAVMEPGQKSRVHTHPGPEGWYVLAGEQCLESSAGVFRARAGQTAVVPGNVPMELSVGGTAIRKALVVVIHDARQERGTLAQWTPPGACAR